MAVLAVKDSFYRQLTTIEKSLRDISIMIKIIITQCCKIVLLLNGNNKAFMEFVSLHISTSCHRQPCFE